MKSLTAFTEISPQTGNLQIAHPPDEWFIFEKPEKPVTLNQKKDGHDNRKGNTSRTKG